MANDMQFFIVGMLVLFVYVKSKFAAYGFMLISIMLSNIFGFILLRVRCILPLSSTSVFVDSRTPDGEP